MYRRLGHKTSVAHLSRSGTGVSEMATESLRRSQRGKAHTRIRAAQ
jgi:hypothetical protein